MLSRSTSFRSSHHGAPNNAPDPRRRSSLQPSLAIIPPSRTPSLSQRRTSLDNSGVVTTVTKTGRSLRCCFTGPNGFEVFQMEPARVVTETAPARASIPVPSRYNSVRSSHADLNSAGLGRRLSQRSVAASEISGHQVFEADPTASRPARPERAIRAAPVQRPEPAVPSPVY